MLELDFLAQNKTEWTQLVAGQRGIFGCLWFLVFLNGAHQTLLLLLLLLDVADWCYPGDVGFLALGQLLERVGLEFRVLGDEQRHVESQVNTLPKYYSE